MNQVRVAIDGPSGTGKSSVSKLAAKEHGWGYLDTGAMYRALTWWCLDQGIDLIDTWRTMIEILGTGRVRAIGTIVNFGRRTALAEARMEDEAGRLIAHGSSSCLVFPLEASPAGKPASR